MKRLLLALALLAAVLSPRDAAAAGRGILLLAHGGSAEWNEQVTALAARIDRSVPTEVAFGMATRATMQTGIDRLVARGVTEVVAVPLFISSWSSIITSSEYLLGQRPDAPAALEIFARMNHGPAPAAATPAAGDHSHHDAPGAASGTTPVMTTATVRMTPALNDHPIVADILASRAKSISRDPRNESVIIVAHGPNEEEDNARWLEDMRALARMVGEHERFASIDVLTLRDDADETVRNAATAQLRQIVSANVDAARRVLIVPLLVSFGGIDRGLKERLQGLEYTMPSAALVPDDRLVDWVLAMAGGR